MRRLVLHRLEDRAPDLLASHPGKLFAKRHPGTMLPPMPGPFPDRPGLTAMAPLVPFLRSGTAAVWILFGLVFKVLDVVPRHQVIVTAVIGEELAGPVTLLIGAAETAMGAWILSRWRPRACAAAQTVAITAMNALELTMAREHLLAPVPMVCANTVFLAAGWYLALHTHAAARGQPAAVRPGAP